MKGIQTRGSAVLMWRLGPLKPAKQDRWDRAPEAKGLWCFPWPYFDEFFAYGQYTRLLPKELKSRREMGLEGPGSYLPADLARLRTESGSSVTGLTPVEEEPGWDYLVCSTTGEEVTADETWQTDREAWINDVGRKILPLRKFWYSGPLYTHIHSSGRVGDPGTSSMRGEDTDWYLMDAIEFARLVKKIRGREGIQYSKEKGLATYRYSIDHLEVFIPAKGGKIS